MPRRDRPGRTGSRPHTPGFDRKRHSSCSSFDQAAPRRPHRPTRFALLATRHPRWPPDVPPAAARNPRTRTTRKPLSEHGMVARPRTGRERSGSFDRALRGYRPSAVRLRSHGRGAVPHHPRHTAPGRPARLSHGWSRARPGGAASPSTVPGRPSPPRAAGAARPCSPWTRRGSSGWPAPVRTRPTSGGGPGNCRTSPSSTPAHAERAPILDTVARRGRQALSARYHPRSATSGGRPPWMQVTTLSPPPPGTPPWTCRTPGRNGADAARPP